MDVYICSTCISMHKHVNHLYPLVYLDKCSVSLNFYNIPYISHSPIDCIIKFPINSVF